MSQEHLDPMRISNHFRRKQVVSALQFKDSAALEPVFVPFGAPRVDRKHWAFEALGYHQFRLWPHVDGGESEDGWNNQRAEEPFANFHESGCARQQHVVSVYDTVHKVIEVMLAVNGVI
jgi:hypothetical protein